MIGLGTVGTAVNNVLGAILPGLTGNNQNQQNNRPDQTFIMVGLAAFVLVLIALITTRGNK